MNQLCVCAKLPQLCPTPWTVAHRLLCPCDSPGSNTGVGEKKEYWSGLPCPPPGDLPNPETEPMSLTSPALVGEFFITSTTGSQL